MSDTKIELRSSAIKFLLKEGSDPKEINERMVAVYAENAPSYFQIKLGLNSHDGVLKISMLIQNPDNPLKFELKIFGEKSKI